MSQKTKLIELTNEYAVFDGDGRQIGAVVQVGQSSLKKAMRLVSNFDQFLTHHLEVRDARGPVLVLTRPGHEPGYPPRTDPCRAEWDPEGSAQARRFTTFAGRISTSTGPRPSRTSR